MDEPLTAKDGFPDFEKLNESEQIRAIVTKRVSDFIKNLDRRFWHKSAVMNQLRIIDILT